MSDQLQHEREERLLNLAAMACQAQEDEDFEAFLNSDEYVPPDPEWVEKMEKELRTPPKRRIPLVRYLVTAALVAVIALMVSVSANPKGLGRTNNQDYGRYSQVSLDDGVVLEKPEGWQSEYYPTWAPSGFYIENVAEADSSHVIVLLNKYTNKKINFSVFDEGMDSYTNTENFEEIGITVFGEKQIAYISENGDELATSIRANNDDIVIKGQLTTGDLEMMIEKVKNLN